MTERWNRGKPKAGFPPVSTAPWKSRTPHEISTFPQPGRTADGKSGKPKPGFPLFPRAIRDYECGLPGSKKTKIKTLWTGGKPPFQSEDTANIAVLQTAERVPAVPADFRIIIRLENACPVAHALATL